MKVAINLRENEELPKNIIGMLRLDYFDDAVGQMEGFQIFEDLMRHGNEPPLSHRRCSFAF